MSKFDLSKLTNKYIQSSGLYAGGLTRDEVRSKIGNKKLYKLSSNENGLGASPKAVEAIKAVAAGVGEYPDRGDDNLRNALSQYYGTMGANHFICGNSGSEVLDFIIRAFLGEGLEYIVTYPFFKPYEMFSDKIGAVMIDVPLKKEDDFALDVDGVIDAITNKTRVIFLTSPNNPTGTIIPRETMRALLERIPDHVVVVYDEVYARYVDNDDYAEAQEFVREGYPIIGLNSFSKLFGLAGLRIGYAYTIPEIAEYLRRMYKPFLINALSLAGATAALSDTKFINETVQLVQSEKYKIYDALDKLGVKYWKSYANFILIDAGRDDKELEQALLMEGIMVRPAGGFGAPGCIRVTIGTAESNTAFIQALQKVLK